MFTKKGLWLTTAVLLCLGYNFARAELNLEALNRAIKEKGYRWVAGTTSVSELSLEEQQRLCGTKPIPYREIAPRIKSMPKRTPPPSFDWRNEGGHDWSTPIKNQGNCGSCWAFAVIAPFETVLKLAFDKPDTNINLAEQFLVSCDTRNNGCSGGRLDWAAKFLEETGVVDEACFSYRAQDRPCSERCSDWDKRVETVDDWGGVIAMNDIKNAIMDYGPLATSMVVYEDFMYYSGGVYKHTRGDVVGYHAIAIFGWDDNQRCWIGKNSWGRSWGEDGWFRIEYGECGIFNPSHSPGIWFERVKADKPYIRIWKEEIQEPKDNIWDPGESANLIVTLTNRGLGAGNVKALLSTTDPNITITDNTSEYDSIPLRGIADNSKDPFKVAANSNAPSEYNVPFTLHITADGGYERDVMFNGRIGILPGEVKEAIPVPLSDTALLYGLAYDGTNLWASEWFSRVIYKINPTTGKIVGQIPAPAGMNSCVDIEFDRSNNVLWVQNNNAKKIYKLNPSNGSVLASFNSPAQQYPTGLAWDGENLWVADRDAYKIYKITTTGSVVQSFTIPISPRPYVGPRSLAFEPKGPDGGSLLLVMTHFTASGDLDSTVLWEINRNGSLVKGHHFSLPPSNGRAVEKNPATGEYWVNSTNPTTQIYRVTGFYRGTPTGIEGPLTPEISPLSFVISPSLSRNRVVLKFHIPETKAVNIDIYDVTGKRVNRLADGLFLAGNHILSWNGRDSEGRVVPQGIYFFSLKSEDYTGVKKAVLMR